MNKKPVIFLMIFAIIIILSFLVIKYYMETSAISKLQLTIKGVQIQEIKVTYTKLKLNIALLNPTDEVLSQFLTEYNIIIAGNIVGVGNITLSDIPARTNKETNTTITIYFSDVAIAVLDAIKNQNFNLTIQGTLHIKVLFDLLSISQDFSSTFSYS